MLYADGSKKAAGQMKRTPQYVWIWVLVLLFSFLGVTPSGAGNPPPLEECYDDYLEDRAPCQAIMKKMVTYEARIKKKTKKIAKKARSLKAEFEAFGDEETVKEAQARADLIREYESNIESLETILGRYNELYMNATNKYDTCIDTADDKYFKCFVYHKGLYCPIAEAKKRLKNIAYYEDKAREQLAPCVRKCQNRFVKAMALFTEAELAADRHIEQNRIRERLQCETSCEHALRRAERKADADRVAFQEECGRRDD